MNTEKTPLGIKPKWIHQQQRFVELCGAIQRYTNAHLQVPTEWIDEYNELLEFVQVDESEPDETETMIGKRVVVNHNGMVWNGIIEGEHHSKYAVLIERHSHGMLNRIIQFPKHLCTLVPNKYIIHRFKVFEVLDETDEHYIVKLNTPPYGCLQFRKDQCELTDIEPNDKPEKVPYEKLVELLKLSNRTLSFSLPYFNSYSLQYSQQEFVMRQIQETLDKL